MKYIAHRGLVEGNIKDSSYEALKNALDIDKYIGVETDIRVTKDKEFILYHNVLFKGNLVKNTLYKEFKKENILKLSDLLKIETKKILLLEIKDFDMDLESFLKILNKYDRNIYIMSFDNRVIKKLKNKNIKYKLGVLNYIINTEENYNYDFICLLNDILDDYIIKIYKNKNIEVIGYGVWNKDLKYDLTYIVDDKYVK